MTKNELSKNAIVQSHSLAHIFLAVVVLLCIAFVAAMWWAVGEGMQKPPSPTPPLSNWQWASLTAILSIFAYILFPRLVAGLATFTPHRDLKTAHSGSFEETYLAASSGEITSVSPADTAVGTTENSDVKMNGDKTIILKTADGTESVKIEIVIR